MSTIDDIDEKYLLKKHIAEEQAVEAVIDTVTGTSRGNGVLLCFDINNINLGVKFDVFESFKSDMITFLQTMNISVPQVSNIENFDIKETLEGKNLTISINEDLDTIYFDENMAPFDVKECDDIDTSWDSSEDYSRTLCQQYNYVQNKNNTEGWKLRIDSLEPLSDDKFKIHIEGFDISWDVSFDGSMDASESAEVQFIENVGKPGYINNEYITVVHEKNVKDDSYVISSSGVWCLVEPSQYNSATTEPSVSIRTKLSNIQSDVPVILLLILAFVIGLLFVSLSGSPLLEGGQSYVSIDHKYPSGNFFVIVEDTESVERVVVQADSSQYEFTNQSLITIYPSDSENQEYVYNPGEEVKLLVYTESREQPKLISYKTSTETGDEEPEYDSDSFSSSPTPTPVPVI